MGTFLALWCAWLVAMGPEVRWLGVPRAPWTETAGALLIAASIGIVSWTCAANSYAAPVVRIQAERHHRVATTGPYRFVRHPMYSGSLLMLAGIPLVLGTYQGLA
jgi:protein-S-isoprenylcysteine O-methyltransferase Ste14